MADINLQGTTSAAMVTNALKLIGNPPEPTERPGASAMLRIMVSPGGSFAGGGPTTGQLFPVGNR